MISYNNLNGCYCLDIDKLSDSNKIKHIQLEHYLNIFEPSNTENPNESQTFEKNIYNLLKQKFKKNNLNHENEDQHQETISLSCTNSNSNNGYVYHKTPKIGHMEKKQLSITVHNPNGTIIETIKTKLFIKPDLKNKKLYYTNKTINGPYIKSFPFNKSGCTTVPKEFVMYMLLDESSEIPDENDLNKLSSMIKENNTTNIIIHK